MPIVVYNADEIAATLCPDLPMPEVNVYLPPMRVLKSVVERMKAINDTVVISTNRAGELTLTVETSVNTAPARDCTRYSTVPFSRGITIN